VCLFGGVGFGVGVVERWSNLLLFTMAFLDGLKTHSGLYSFAYVGAVESERRAAKRQHRFVLNGTSLKFCVTGIIGFLVAGKLVGFPCSTPD
jgi:hypothetical protein